MDGAHVDALSRWIDLRSSRRAFVASLTGLVVVGGRLLPAEAKRHSASRTRRSAAKRRNRGQRHDHPARLPSLSSEVQVEIVGGTAVLQGTFTFAAYIQIDLGNNRIGACTGSLITPRHVLTAAHCVVDSADQVYAPGQFLTAVGRGLIQNVPQANIWPVDAVYKHPDYDPGTIRNDVAILQLDGSVPASIAQPVALVGSNDVRFDSPGQAAVVAGWGRTSGSGAPSAQLLRAPLAIISDAACAQDIVMEPDVQICARYSTTSGCNGDSGGPLLVMPAAVASEPGRMAAHGSAVAVEKKGKKRHKKGKGRNAAPPPVPPPPASPPVSPPPPPPVALTVTQLGVVSFGYETCPPGGVNVFTQLSAPAVRSFITEVAGV